MEPGSPLTPHRERRNPETWCRLVLVLPAWATVILTLGGVLIGGLIGLAGVISTNRQAARLREADKLDEQRLQGAKVISPLLHLLSDAHPSLILPYRNFPWTANQFKELGDRWERVRAQLGVYTASHPSPEVATLGGALSAAVDRLLLTIRVGLGKGVDDEALKLKLKEAEAKHKEAMALGLRLLMLVRGEPDPGRLATRVIEEADGE
jgi:hypothetical protein